MNELLYMDFLNTVEQIKEQYFMEIRSAVLEILDEGRQTGRNVESKTPNFVNSHYESSENGGKKNLYCCFYLLANRNFARKVQRPTPTVLTRSTLTMFTQIVSAISLSYHIIYFHSVDPYRITKSI